MKWLAALVVMASAASAYAWEPVAGTRELGPRWSGPLIYRLNEKGSDDLDREVLLAEVHKGMLEWTTPDCTSASARYDGLTAELPSTADVPGADNVIAFREAAWTDGPEAVAVTAPSFISTGSGKPPQIVAATMWLNGQHWTWVTGATQERQINAYSVFLHEAGHYWGLGHTAVPMSVMNKRYSRDAAGLAADDIEGICSLYPHGKVESGDEERRADEADAGPRGAEADGCSVDSDCASSDERCVAGRCLRLADPPLAMCRRDEQCDADQTCKAGKCVAAGPEQPGLSVGSDCIMDSDCESGMCQLSGEATQCTDFCETDRDCGAAGHCVRDGRQTGLCGALSLAPLPHPTERDAALQVPRDATQQVPGDASGCSAAGSSATASMIWLLIIPWLLRRAWRSPRRTHGSASAQQRNPREELA